MRRIHFIKSFFVVLQLLAFVNIVQAQEQSLPQVGKTFTIIAHVILDEEGEPNLLPTDLDAQMEKLNELFALIDVSFELCDVRYIANYQYDFLEDGTTTEWEELQVKYKEDHRINIFFVGAFENSGVCGFAPLGGITQPGSCIVIKKGTCMAADSYTIPHEMGHYFGLQHTFTGSGAELVDGSNCLTVGDGFCDTPADPFPQNANPADYLGDDCVFNHPGQDANGDYYLPDVTNIMSYYNGCVCRFSYDQYRYMAQLGLASGMW